MLTFAIEGRCAGPAIDEGAGGSSTDDGRPQRIRVVDGNVEGRSVDLPGLHGHHLHRRRHPGAVAIARGPMMNGVQVLDCSYVFMASSFFVFSAS